jgi:hypothetical protein
LLREVKRRSAFFSQTTSWTVQFPRRFASGLALAAGHRDGAALRRMAENVGTPHELSGSVWFEQEF